MTQPEPKYIASDGPVNRRTASRKLRDAPAVNPLVSERLAAAQARNRLGPSLAEQVRAGSAPARRAALPALAIVGAIAATVAAVVLFLGWLQSSLLLALAGLAGVVIGLGLAWHAQRRQDAAAAPAHIAATLLDDSALQALDHALEQLGPELPEAVVERLTALKELIVRMARLGNQAGIDENFTMEDRLYVNECVRRYLPDTLQSYLKVPREQRASTALEGGRNAVDMLLGQLELLRVELAEREERLARTAAEGLVKQQRFLQAKARR
jgi:hypothetical protein